jgi:hypothetical protein
MSQDYDHRGLQVPRTSGKAIATLICGLLSFCVPLLGTILAIAFGALALKDIGRSRDRLKGRGLAIAGLVIGVLGLVPIPLHLSFLRKAALQVQLTNQMKQIGMAIHAYNHQHGTLPPAVVYGPDGQPLYSWRVLILPFLGEGHLYNQFKLDEPWDSPNNKRLLTQMPQVYVLPSQRREEPYATFFQVFTGGGTLFEVGPNSAKRPIGQITGDPASTIMIVEAAEPVPWSKPADLPYAPDQPLPQLGILRDYQFTAVMADGTVHTIRKAMDEKGLRALITSKKGS